MDMLETELFTFKQKSQDFIVEEELPFELSGTGDAFFVYFEKRNLNTMDVVNHLCSELNISRMALGIAGLKDKKAITRQRISIYKRALKRIWWENIFLNTLEEKVKIIKTDWHDKPIGMTTQIKNIFHIRLRANKNLSEKERDLTSKKLNYLFDNGFPNFFGEQRFGINGRNWKQGKSILEWKLNLNKKSETIFKLQSYASKMFNEYVISRVKKWLKLINGDIVEVRNVRGKKLFGVYEENSKKINLFEENREKDKDKHFFRYPNKFQKKVDFDDKNMVITGPVVGYNLLICDKNSDAGIKEKSFLDARKIDSKKMIVFSEYHVYGIRRALWVFPSDVNMKFQGDDLLVSFALPSGTYASILVDEILGMI